MKTHNKKYQKPKLEPQKQIFISFDKQQIEQSNYS